MKGLEVFAWCIMSNHVHLVFRSIKDQKPDLFKNPDMLKRLNEIDKMEKEDKNHILYAIDALIKSVKFKNIAAL